MKNYRTKNNLSEEALFIDSERITASLTVITFGEQFNQSRELMNNGNIKSRIKSVFADKD